MAVVRLPSHPLRIGSAGALALLAVLAHDARALGGACSKSTQALLVACEFSARDDKQVGTAICINDADPVSAQRCLDQLQNDTDAALAQCPVMERIRSNVCRALGDVPYDPPVRPSNFVPTITNPWAPFKPGAWWEYRAHTADGEERDRVEVTDDQRQIMGVNVTTVHDRVWLDGQLIEDTLDWLAQDRKGNVWYMGELSKSIDENGLIDNIDGSWEAGKNGARPGIWMQAAPAQGQVYRQEYDPDNAEDMALIQDTHSPEPVPFSNGSPVLQIHEFTALEPDDAETKYYVPGIGAVLERDPSAGETFRLVSFFVP